MKNLVTITGAPASKGQVVREVTWQLTKSLAALVINQVIVRTVVRSLIR